MRKVTPSHQIRKLIRTRDSSFHPQNKRYKWWVLANVMIGTFMAVLDGTIVNTGLPKIMASFGVGIDKIQWVVTAYMLAMAVALPTAGWLADKFGYKRMYFMGMLLFTIGSALCGMSPDENMLIISRIIQGIGAGCVQPIGMAIVTREFPPQQRGVALGFWSIAAAASVSFGPLFGGYLVDNFSWPLIFDVNIPIGIIGLLATIVIQKEHINKQVRNFDLLGFISVSLFLPLLLYAFTEGNAVTNSAGWSAPHVLLCFGISAIALAVFITAELTTDQPLIDLRLLGEHNFGICNIIMLLFGIGMFGSTFLLPLFLQNSLGNTAVQSGSVFLPVGIIQGALAPVIGRVADKTNAKIPIIIGISLLTFSFILNSHFSFLTEHHFIMTSLYVRGVGLGMIFTPLNTISLLGIPREKMAQASGITNTVRQLGGSFGVAILTTILTARITYHSQMYGGALNPDSQVYQNVQTNLGYHIQQSLGKSKVSATSLGKSVIVAQANKEAYIQAINDDFTIAAVATILGGLPVLLLRTRKKQLYSKSVKK